MASIAPRDDRKTASIVAARAQPDRRAAPVTRFAEVRAMLRRARAPDVGWSDMLQSYELRGAIVACGPVSQEKS